MGVNSTQELCRGELEGIPFPRKRMPDSLMPRPDATVGRNRERCEFVLAEKSARLVVLEI